MIILILKHLTIVTKTTSISSVPGGLYDLIKLYVLPTIYWLLNKW